jgi:tetratricopeptide (TPR) repeat protein
MLEETVFFEVNNALAKQPPDCIYVTPFDDPKSLDPAQNFRKAFHAQLSITGVRLIPIQAINRSQDCAYELRGSVTDNGKTFLGVFSEYKAGARVSLVHLPSQASYWNASHTLVKRAGALPIGIISALTGVASAARNLESDQAIRVSHELAYRMVQSIPNLRYVESPASPSPSLAGKPEGSPIAQAPREPASDEDRLKEALAKGAHAEVVAAIDAMSAKGKINKTLLLQRALAYQSLSQHEKATTDFIGAIALGENTDNTYTSLGRSYAALGRFDFAAVAFEKATSLNDKNFEALLLGGVAHSANGDDDLAYEQLRKALVTSLAATDKVNARRALNALQSTGLFERLTPKDQQFVQSQL